MRTPRYIKEMATELAKNLSIIEYGMLVTEMQKPRIRKLNQLKRELGIF